jgi:hypothetical protein
MHEQNGLDSLFKVLSFKLLKSNFKPKTHAVDENTIESITNIKNYLIFSLLNSLFSL